MTLRSLVLGLVLAILIAVGSHFNDSVIRQTYLTGNYLPPAVFGVAVLLVLAVQRRTGSWGLRAAEIVIIVAIALAGSGWAGNSFGRMFTSLIATPWHWERAITAWKSSGVLSYMPRGRPDLAKGFVRDWDALRTRLLDEGGSEGRQDPSARVWEAVGRSLDPDLRDRLRAQRDQPVADDRRVQLILAINQALRDHVPLEAANPVAFDLTGDAAQLARRYEAGEALGPIERQVLGREMLAAAAPEALYPMPRGQGLLLPYREATLRAVDGMILGRPEAEGLWPAKVPWDAWWEGLKVWLPLALCFGVAMLCLSLIVHPQWADRERLAYPIARFIDNLAHLRAAPGEGLLGLPKLFWLGLLSVAALHALNSLHALEPRLPHLPLEFNFQALDQLFPSAMRVQVTSRSVFHPVILPSMIAFATLVTSRVALSVGLASYVWIAFSVVMLQYGVVMQSDRLAGGPRNLLLFGSYLGAAVMLIYVGRTYYAHVVRAAAGLGRRDDVPGYAAWAARGLVPAVAGMVVVFIWSGMSWPIAMFTVGCLLLLYTVLTRVVVETGLIFFQADWAPVGIALGLMGFAAIGPTDFLLISMASAMFALSVRDVLMPHLQHGLYMISRERAVPVRRFGLVQLGVLTATLFLTVGAILSMQYHYGLNLADAWPNKNMPSAPFWRGTVHLENAAAFGELGSAMNREGFEKILAADPEGQPWVWLLIGLALVVGTGWARLKLSWWPIHPVLFLVWGTLGPAVLSVSFLLGWAIKMATVKVGGAKGYNQVKPLMVGVICGELLAALAWIIGGTIYFAWAGFMPPQYRVFPG